MKTGINYILLLISMLCLPVEYVVAVNNAEVTSQSCGWLVEKTNHGEKFLKANSGIENTFKNDNYAFDAWLQGAKGAAAVGELTDADMSPGLVGVDGGNKELEYAPKVIPPANTIDIIIHAVGGSYKFEVNGAYIPGDHRVLAGWLRSKGYNTKTIRLLSCSDITSAQNLCNKLNQPVIATDGYVCIYSDGGLSVVPRTSNGDTKWYLLKPNAVRNEAASPRAPGSADLDYVQMGGAKSPANPFNLTAFKNAVAKIPGVDNASLTNLPQSFWNDAYKVTPVAGSVLKTKVDYIIANGDPGGDLTEELIDIIFAGKGYKQGDGKYFGDVGNNGIDRFYYKGSIDNPTEIIVFEAKQLTNGSATLNGASNTTQLPVQMRDAWLYYIANQKLTGQGGLKEQTANAIKNAPPGFIQKYIVAVDKTTGQIYFLKLGSY